MNIQNDNHRGEMQHFISLYDFLLKMKADPVASINLRFQKQKRLFKEEKVNKITLWEVKRNVIISSVREIMNNGRRLGC